MPQIWPQSMQKRECTVSLPEKESTAQPPGKVIYTAKTHTVGGRENGLARSSDGRIDVKLSLPGSPRMGTNPEQLFGAGWSACFESSIGIAARRKGIPPPEITIDAEIDLHLADGEYFVSARFNISLPGLNRNIAQSLIEEAEQICTYSKATRGNIDVVFNLV
jgi:osmotically inducible protein OsmC